MEIKIDIKGSSVELEAFLHSLTINHSRKTEAAVKTANTKKKRTSQESPKGRPGTGPTDDILDDPEMADIRDYIFEDGD